MDFTATNAVCRRGRNSSLGSVCLLTALLASTSLVASPLMAANRLPAGGDAAASVETAVPSTAPAQSVSVELTEALKLAVSYGQSSLIASVYENTRITPFRADAVVSQAIALAPGLSREIRLATDLALSHARRMGLGAAASENSLRAATALPPGADNAVDLSTMTEFQRNWGLGAIGAQEAVIRNLTGKGVVVGVVDTGLDMLASGTPHSEFTGRVDERSASLYHWYDPNLAVAAGDVAAGFNRPSNASTDGSGHGTHVAGIIAAARDGNGMQGVAPGATILAIQGLASVQPSQFVDESNNFVINGTTYNAAALAYCGSAIYLTDEDQCTQANQMGIGTTAAITYLATQKDVRVINGSFGPDPAAGEKTWATGDLAEEATAVRASLMAGQILTIAAGNERAKAPIYGENPSGIGLFPFINPSNAFKTNSAGERIYSGSDTADFSDMTDASLAAAEAADGIKRGRIIVVVATDSKKVIADYSNTCGVAAEWCIAAPGGTYDDSVERPIYSTYTGGEYKALQGTSMAAPHVAGALAVLIEAFPTYTPAQITNILFETAEDLGAAGTDSVYGRGFLRLDLALQSGPAGLDPADKGKFVAGAGAAKGDKTVWTKQVDSSGSLGKQGEGTLVLLGNASFDQGVAVEQGELRVDGNLTGAFVTVAKGGTMSGNGKITANVTSNGTLSPGQSPGLLTINGNLTLAAGSQTDIEVDGTAAQVGAGGFDRISVEGTGRTATVGGILAPTLRGISGSANNTFTPSLGNGFKFLEVVNGQVVGSFASLLQPAAGLAANTRFDVVYGASSLTLATTPLSYANLGAFGVAQSAAAKAVGSAIDAARPAAGVRPTSDLSALFSSLYLGDAKNLGLGLEQATGQIYVDSGQSAVLSVGRFADQLWQHQTDLSIAGAPEGDATRLWSQGDAWFTNTTGYRSESASATFGMDVPLNTGWVGGVFRYEGTGISAGTNGKADLGTYQAAAHGQIEYGAVQLSGRAGLTYGQLDVSRRISFGAGAASTLKGKDNGFGGFAEATVQKTIALGETRAIPSLTFGYRAFGFDGTRETGDFLPLTTSGKTFRQGHVTAAVTVSHRFDLDNGYQVTPVGTVGYRRDLLPVSDYASATVLGTGFTTHGPEIGRDALVGSVKLQAGKGEGLSFATGYDIDIRKGARQHRLSGSLTMRW
ncbi:S8 family serine peptidase [Hoeflea alexandrii]|uniref:S8 family serine peptidase n=1 Tax=Hoeflea alexandrii TaxID=288436 RepID=UPI0022AF9E54|nr:S8 family serine peptidase [Hoeflea alexandrii]MCZ4288694.1 S8 family serine peptidase [Hoeflea alexandrii]